MRTGAPTLRGMVVEAGRELRRPQIELALQLGTASSSCATTARAAASASGWRTKVPAKNVTPTSGIESSP